MHVQLHNDQSADRFSKQLLEIGSGQVRIDNTNGLIGLQAIFCRNLQSKEETSVSAYCPESQKSQLVE
jgi:hypothetical protein